MWKIKRFISPLILWTNKFALFCCWKRPTAAGNRVLLILSFARGIPVAFGREYGLRSRGEYWFRLAGEFGTDADGLIPKRMV